MKIKKLIAGLCLLVCGLALLVSGWQYLQTEKTLSEIRKNINMGDMDQAERLINGIDSRLLELLPKEHLFEVEYYRGYIAFKQAGPDNDGYKRADKHFQRASRSGNSRFRQYALLARSTSFIEKQKMDSKRIKELLDIYESIAKTDMNTADSWPKTEAVKRIYWILKNMASQKKMGMSSKGGDGSKRQKAITKEFQRSTREQQPLTGK